MKKKSEFWEGIKMAVNAQDVCDDLTLLVLCILLF